MGGTMLVGVDGTLAGRTALGWALGWARTHGQSVELVHVVDDDRGRLGASVLRDRHERAAALLARETEHARTDPTEVEVACRLLHGHPVTRLAEAARSASALVVGTHKTGFAQGRVFGSLGLRLAPLVTRPLIVIPTEGRRQRRRVVVGLGDAGETPVEFAAHAASHSGHELVVLRAGSEPDDVEESRRLEGAVAIARRTMPGLTVRARRTSAPAGESLAVASESAELTVVGRRRDDAPLPLGATGMDLLMNPGGPVAVIPFDAPRKRAARP
ncbi:universal stress protein [Cnuibacter physcomitrellae]|uniref:universal stress protein n=1 Tax=Cnuibacter physcomitrellae TaxID=1619308 RepID=UPI002175EC63|nr:universal stress protein [Cnuibacter physcomitrellae]MCS5497021.1 universal stress protein [Cnuibacter physcomitrellae]